MSHPTLAPKPLILFYSYSHKDEKLRDSLATHLKLLNWLNVVADWHDRRIDAGKDLFEVIDEKLDAADIILLLVSPDFLASESCWGEMTRALERQRGGEAQVIPVIVRPVDWNGAPFGYLEALPKDGKPVILWKPQDSAWLDVAKGIRKVAEKLATSQPLEPKASDASVLTSNMENLTKKIGQKPTPPSNGKLQRIIYSNERSASFGLSLRPARREGDPPTVDPAVNEVYDSLGITYNFFWDVYRRNSIDNQGMALVASVHDGAIYDNAFWSGRDLIFRDGDGRFFNRFSFGLDQIAHLVMRGIIQIESQIIYYQQSGALILSIADIFGSLVKQYALHETVAQADWLFGAGIFTSQVKGVALRSLAAPGTAYDDPVFGRDPQPAHMKGYYRGAQDNGGVHINGGIPNHAFYHIALSLGGYAWEKAGRIWYETLLDKRLKENAQFRDFARLTFSNAQRLFGASSDEAEAVKQGWGQVGIKVTRL